MVHELSSDEQKKLLMFCTGTMRALAGGMAKLDFKVTHFDLQ